MTSQDYPQLGRYQVINRIASGGMAEVFLAKAVGAMGFQRLVALKLIHENFTRDEDFVNMFIDEARIAMHLHHRNIVQVFDLDKVAGTYFIAMEYVHGVNLYDLYERIAEHHRWIDPPLALYLIAEICKGLHFAHTRTDSQGKPLNIIHRDISPQNVLLSFEGEVKITDFGIATAAQRLHQTAAGIVKGKYAYMAPERLQEKPIDARVDVFSIGVLMYELLAGENPYAGGSAVETIENVLQREVPPPSSRGAPVTRDLDEICLKALAKEPGERFSDAQALADVLTEYAMDQTVARKDMAAGDAAVAQLLGQLFPERANRQPTAAKPGSLIIPGLDEIESNMDTDVETSGASVGPHPDDDFDAPTVLKMDAVLSAEEKRNARDRQQRPPPASGNTSPTELPGAKPDPTVPSEAVSPDDAPYAPTMPSRAVDQPAARPGYPVAPSRSSNPPPPEPARRASDSQEGLARPERSGGRLNNIVAIMLLIVAVLVVVAAMIVSQRGQASVPGAMLELRTDPPGATVFVNGRRLATVTPVKERVASLGTLVVELELAGHKPVRKELSARAGEVVTVDETLVAAEGELVITPTPLTATVLVNGKSKGQGKVHVAGLSLGRSVEVRVTLEGFTTETEVVTLSSEQPRREIVIPLTPQMKSNGRRRTATRRVKLTAPNGTWANVFYRGQALGSTPIDAVLPVGTVKLRVRNDEISLNKQIRIRVPRSGSDQIRLPL